MDSSPYSGREQTEVKHRALERYLQAATRILGRSWVTDFAYIDCCAGPWGSRDPGLADTSFSRAVAVLNDAAKTPAIRGNVVRFHALLIEKEPEPFQRLKSFAESQTQHVTTTAENWDFTEHIDDIVSFARTGNTPFAFTFIDPKGWEVATIDTIAPLLRIQPGEVVINLMTSWVRRFLSDESKNFERLLGPEVGRLRQLTGEDQEDELVRCYAEAVRVAGAFEYVCALPILKSDQDCFHYSLIYATRHQKGVEVFKHTERDVTQFMHHTRAVAQEQRRTANGQMTFFDADERYQEHRYSRFRQKNLALAKTALSNLLMERSTVSFDDAWIQTMQYAAVHDDDLRSWISEWSGKGLLQVLNMQPRQRFPHRGENNLIQWRGPRRAPGTTSPSGLAVSSS